MKNGALTIKIRVSNFCCSFLLAVVFISFAAPILRLLNIGLNLSLSAIILTCVSDELIVGTAALPRPVLSTH